MPIEFEDKTGTPRSDAEIREALKHIQREVITNMFATFKDGTPAVPYYIVIIEAMKELLRIREAIRNHAEEK